MFTMFNVQAHGGAEDMVEQPPLSRKPTFSLSHATMSHDLKATRVGGASMKQIEEELAESFKKAVEALSLPVLYVDVHGISWDVHGMRWATGLEEIPGRVGGR